MVNITVCNAIFQKEIGNTELKHQDTLENKTLRVVSMTTFSLIGQH